MFEREETELNEVISRAGRTKLPPRLVAVLARDAADGPVLIHDGVFLWLLVDGADTETSSVLNRLPEPSDVLGELTRRQIEDRQLHATGNIDADGIRHDGVVQSQHSADGQSVPEMRVGHKRRADSHRERAGMSHLAMTGVVDVVAPGPVRDRLGRNEVVCLDQLPCEAAEVRIGLVSGRLGENLRDQLLDLVPTQVALLGGELDSLDDARQTFIWDTEFAKLSCVHSGAVDRSQGDRCGVVRGNRTDGV